MKQITPERLTFTRVGPNEPWCGWQIAGQTPSVSSISVKEFTKNQGINGTAATAMLEYTGTEPIYEWICKNNNTGGAYVYLTKLKYGFLDDSRPTHAAGMRADGIVLQNNSEFNAFDHLYEIFSIDKKCFDNHLLIDEKRDENGELILSEISQSDANTPYKSESYSCKDDFNVVSSVKKYFENNEIYVELIKCVYWVMTYDHWTSLQIICDKTTDEIMEIMAIIFNSVIPSVRPLISFRTTAILPPAPPVRIEFHNKVATGGRFFNLSTGENNVFSGLIKKRYEKYSFMEYYPRKINEIDSKLYFEKLTKLMDELGEASSLDLNLIKIAQELYEDEYDETQVELTNIEIMKKLQNFLSLPYNNDKIDWHISKLLEMIIEKRLSINESLQNHLNAKLKKTSNSQLIDIGYSYLVRLMVSDSNRKTKFAELEGFMSKPEVFEILRKKIIAEIGGALFLDEFYGDYIGPKTVTDTTSLTDFVSTTKNLPAQSKINVFILDAVKKIGYQMVDDFLDHKIPFAERYSRYTLLVRTVVSYNVQLANKILNELKLYFWKKFDFCTFDFKFYKEYECISYRTNSKAHIAKSMVDILNNIISTRTTSVKSFKKLRESNFAILNEKEIRDLIIYYQTFCCKYLDKSRNFDQWYEIASLRGSRYIVPFIIERRISVFKDDDEFLYELEDSKCLGNSGALRRYNILLNDYADECEDKNEVISYIETAKFAAKELKRIEREQKKKTQRKSMSEEHSAYDDFVFSSSSAMNSSLKNRNEAGSKEEQDLGTRKDGKHSEKKKFFGFLGKKK